MKARNIAPFILAVPSDLPGLDFTVRFEVVWSASKSLKHTDPEALVRDAIRQAVIGAVALHPVTAASEVESRINAVLGYSKAVRIDGIAIHEVRAQVTVDPLTQAKAQAISAQRQAIYLKDLEQRTELARLEEFKNTVLCDLRSALAYWYMKNPHETADLSRVSAIREIVDEMTNTDPSLLWIKVAKVLQPVIQALPAHHINHFLRCIVDGLYAINRSNEASRIRDEMSPNNDAFS